MAARRPFYCKKLPGDPVEEVREAAKEAVCKEEVEK